MRVSLSNSRRPDPQSSAPGQTRSGSTSALRLDISRAALVIATWLYAFAVYDAKLRYLHPVWEYFGFTHRPPDTAELLLMSLLVTCAALCMPSTLTRASGVVLLALFIVVYVPAVVITFSVQADHLANYGPALIALTGAFCLACATARLRLPRSGPRVRAGLPGAKFRVVLSLIWLVMCGSLLFTYGSVMALVALDDVYGQRAAGTSTGLVMGYVQTYFSGVVSPALLALGLLQKRRLLALMGLLGCLVMYMITAQRTIILLPVVITGVHMMLAARWWPLRMTALPVIAVSLLIAVAVRLHEEHLAAWVLAVFLVFRTIAIPGLSFSQYHDLFSSQGFTWWSHVKGFDLLVPIPHAFQGDASWPGLGYIVGERVYGDVAHNVNANLFSGDGLAAAGALGVFVIGLALCAWLRLLDRAAVGWNRRFAILVTIPVALALTNGHLFTTMLSFGGLLWLVVFSTLKPSRMQSLDRMEAGPR